MKLFALVLLFAASCALARPEPRERPGCAAPCYEQKTEDGCDPKQKDCYCAPDSEVPYLVGECILQKCAGNPEELVRALEDAYETCRGEGH